MFVFCGGAKILPQHERKSRRRLLAIEVADTTVKYDRDVKFPRYAANGIREAWLIDLENNRVEIHSEPTENGYSLVKILHRGQTAESSVLTGN